MTTSEKNRAGFVDIGAADVKLTGAPRSVLIALRDGHRLTERRRNWSTFELFAPGERFPRTVQKRAIETLSGAGFIARPDEGPGLSAGEAFWTHRWTLIDAGIAWLDANVKPKAAARGRNPGGHSAMTDTDNNKPGGDAGVTDAAKAAAASAFGGTAPSYSAPSGDLPSNPGDTLDPADAKGGNVLKTDAAVIAGIDDAVVLREPATLESVQQFGDRLLAEIEAIPGEISNELAKALFNIKAGLQRVENYFKA